MADAKVSTFATKAANTCTFTYAYVAANGAYGKVAINASGGLPVYTATILTPYADNTNDIGSSALRWGNIRMGLAKDILWDDGSNSNNAHAYTDAVGPWWHDRTTGFSLFFNVQSLAADRTATWQDSSGTVAWLTDIGPDDPGISIPSTGNTVAVGGPQLLALTGIRPAGALLALTINFVDGITNAVARIVCTQAVTALTVTGNVNLDVTRKLLNNPAALTANQILEYWWDESGSSPCWIRAQ